MQCIGFQKNYSVDPTSLSQRLIEHKNNCPECQRFVDEVSEVDHNLEKATRVEAPEYLVSNLLKIPEIQNKENFLFRFCKVCNGGYGDTRCRTGFNPSV